MKPTITTGLSLAGVLSAGALAAGANLRVFDGTDDPASLSAVGVAQPATAESGTDLASGGRPGAIGFQTFQIGSAGSITLDASDGLHLVATDAAPGWRAEREDAPTGEVIVTFEAAGDHDLTATAFLTSDGIHVSVTGGEAAEGRDDDGPGDDHSGSANTMDDNGNLGDADDD